MNTPHLPTDLEKLLVSTKFAPPRIGSRHLVRSHLLAALRRERHCRLLLITGSAGFGKTILLAQWRQELMKAGSPVAWLSLNPDEKQFPNFCTHLLAAFARLGVAVQDELPLAREGNAQLDGLVVAIVNGAAAIDHDLYLILDDYHHVEDPWAHKLVQKLLDHGPPNLHMIIASRALPPLSVAKLRVMGQVSEIECADLPFDVAETRTFLAQNIGNARLTADEVRQIHDFTNGWPASLQLVSIVLKNRPESRATLSSLAWQSSDLQHYLAEDVVGHLPVELSAFMETLSICRRFNGSLAEALTGREDSASLLARIEDENLLITRAESDNRSPWYRFHPLFAEFLAARLARRGPDAMKALHRRASNWFADRRLIVEAVRHAMLADDLEGAVAIIERAVPGTWQLSYLGPLLHLVENLSLDAIAAHPRLLYLGSLTLAMAGTPSRATAWAAKLNEHARDDCATMFKIALVNATISFQRDDSAQSVTSLDSRQLGEAGSAFERYVYLMIRAMSLAAAGRFIDALQILDLNPIPPEDNDNAMAQRVAGCRTVMLIMMGKVVEAEKVATVVYGRSAATHGRSSTGATLSAVGLAEVYYELDRIDDARELLANRQSSLKTSSPQLMIWSTLCEVRLDLLQDSAHTALALLERRASYFRSLGLDRALAFVVGEQVRILLGSGNDKRAAELVADLDAMASRVDPTPAFSSEILIVAGLARARLALHAGDCDSALHAAQGADEIANKIGRGRLRISLGLVRTLALDATTRTEKALEQLAQLVRTGAELGLIRTFVDEGEALQKLLGGLFAANRLDSRSQDYLEKLLKHFGSNDGPIAADAADPRSKTLLTPREIEILGLVAAGMSNKRIALTLNITLETVKWNLKNIFIKLGVSSRYDAMIWARRQGLID
ncbi:LuxR C-terminal-related transcriptional regulator [Sphingomonas cavernae]|uniref:Helix-turn-helix transcriptional regulator n=1 Tax=Sphingomonas cavernae TaxID=2320861 RepID=A0A418WQZ8_9SPHN|nr:LuxR C-terminal-related transcriptional regulator [Sphingomonas cavernae]RJF93626.1 helix-turn-helix transcriptional regulator [Sphingomonas cavernae]